MRSARQWWDVVIPVSTLIIGTLVLLIEEGTSASQVLFSAGIVTAFIASYFFLGRSLITSERFFPIQYAALVLTISIIIGVSSAVSPSFLLMLTVAYPLMWITKAGRFLASLGTVCLSLAVFLFGLVAHNFDFAMATNTTLSAAFSTVFAIAMGLWISNIVDYGIERDRLVTELTRAQSELAKLHHEHGVSAERERLARDIHDTVSQTLAALVMLSERASRQIAGGHTQQASETIVAVEKSAREALAEARGLVARTAAVPGDEALAAAIGRLAQRFRTEVGLAIDITVNGHGEVNRETQVIVLRCLQEALSNVRKHAQATVVTVTITASQTELTMTVSDDGQGFDSKQIHHGFGLEGMTDRLALAGGSLTIDTRPGAGVTLTATVPREVVPQ